MCGRVATDCSTALVVLLYLSGKDGVDAAGARQLTGHQVWAGTSLPAARTSSTRNKWPPLKMVPLMACSKWSSLDLFLYMDVGVDHKYS